ncbi:DUF4352 domain-containing protein [Mycolicibacterium sp. 018/SC-01/001]|uniref:DUF4352 domain-containing protein n=1 Tax=Mycolicibacterium sp. 018/SC-01/001 TaxID=2592069 RepID=UPI0011802E7D|nr:DUF4352 domain-containing protein [Mycolicibacterium sp. 018/SC-01/001]TRW82754.1 DUF4352 domain-containing protein [Mycolicibacterium sp. 018/SC-01/001]
MTTVESPWRRVSLGRLKWVAALIVIGATAVFGGLDSADRVTPLAMGQSYDDGPLQITVRSAALPAEVDGLRQLTGHCRFLTVDATIHNVSDRSVTLPTAFAVIGTDADCTGPRPSAVTGVIGITGVPAYFKTALRLRDGQPMPTVEPGFTTDYRFAWAVPAAALAAEPAITVRLPKMTEFISTFRIAEDFAGDASEYGDLPLSPQVYR